MSLSKINLMLVMVALGLALMSVPAMSATVTVDPTGSASPGSLGRLSAGEDLTEAHAFTAEDIEVLKVREDEGGTLRLAFGTEQEARRAVELLEGKGFVARVR